MKSALEMLREFQALREPPKPSFQTRGPWKPTTPEEVTEERRRVLECEPHTWWWKPRYELAVLMRDGMDQAPAVEKVRGEVA